MIVLKPSLKQNSLLEEHMQGKLAISSFSLGEPARFICVKDSGDMNKKSQGNSHKTPTILRFVEMSKANPCLVGRDCMMI